MVEYILNLQLFANPNTQTTETSGLSAEMKTYYEKRLLDAAEPKLVHDQFGDKYPIPRNGGKTIEFRKYSALPLPTIPLTEGVTPDGSSLSVSTVTGTVSQWGDYVTISDVLEMTAIDRNIEQATKLLGSQAGKKLDHLVRDVMATGGTVHYPDGAEGRANITAAMPLTTKMVFKAAANLRANNAPEINGDYVAIVHPYVAYDLMTSDGWLDVHKYAQPDEIYEGEIGKLGGVRFVETSEAKIVAPKAICGILKNRMMLETALDTTGSTTICPSVTITSEEAAAINAQITAGTVYEIYVGGEKRTVASVTAGSAGTCALTVNSAVKSKEKGTMVCGIGAGASGADVYCTFVIGSGAYGVTEVSGGGLQHIVKQMGAGDDPLNQRATTGWKALKTAEILEDQYMVRIEHGCTFK